ncbi:MAG: shikimate kinase [Candidatus Eisenbacteria bacterium]
MTLRRFEGAAPVALVGLPGAGKTAVAPLLATRLGWRWDDLDVAIARAAGMGVPELLRSEGEARFRERELEALRRALATPAAGFVLACGGGVVVGQEARRVLAAGATVVWLQVRPETALARLQASGLADRPLLSDAPAGGDAAALRRLRELQAVRDPLYGAIAAISVSTEGRTPEELAAALHAALRDRWAGSAS